MRRWRKRSTTRVTIRRIKRKEKKRTRTRVTIRRIKEQEQQQQEHETARTV